MRFGLCTSLENRTDAMLAAEAGLDYIELPLAATYAKGNDWQQECRSMLSDAGLRAEAFNGFFGAAFHLLGPERTPETQIMDYVRASADMAAQFGAQVLVLGSGRARFLPEGVSAQQAQPEFLALLDQIADVMKDRKLQLVIEPLRYQETNYINTFRQCVELTSALGRAEVAPLLDLYHFFCNEEPMDDLQLGSGGRLRHAHIARPNIDRCPPTGADAAVLRRWAQGLREAGYDGRLSLECRWTESKREEVLEAAKQLKTIFG